MKPTVVPPRDFIFSLPLHAFHGQFRKICHTIKPYVGVLRCFMSLCSFLNLSPTLLGQEAACPGSQSKHQNLMTLAGASLLSPAWTFGELTNLFSVPSVERNPNCLFLPVEMGPPTEYSAFIQTYGWRNIKAPCGQSSGTDRNLGQAFHG